MIGGACSCQEIERMLQDFLNEVSAMGIGTSKGARKKRAPSAYNLFIKECTAGGKKTLAECAPEWKKQKGQ